MLRVSFRYLSPNKIEKNYLRYLFYKVLKWIVSFSDFSNWCLIIFNIWKHYVFFLSVALILFHAFYYLVFLSFFYFHQGFLSRILTTLRTEGKEMVPSFIPLYHFHPLTNFRIIWPLIILPFFYNFNKLLSLSM